jgi:hypothetical protein
LAFFNALETVTKSNKENVVTASTLDLAVWVEYDSYKNSRALFMALKKAYEDEMGPGVLKSVVLNRKMLQLEVAE